MKKVNSKKLISPILFLVFNRLETTKMVFAEIKKVKPKKLFIAADGYRANIKGEKEKCEKVKRYVLDNIDWECDLKTLFRDENLGCGENVTKAITWFFKNVGEGIILEDDCLPDQSFFYFCEELLARYRRDKRVFMISGDNFAPESLADADSSYFFSNIPCIWGWATWRRAWKKFNFDISDLPECIDNIWSDKKINKYWLITISEIHYKKLDAWAYKWVYTIWKNNGVSISPNRNLVLNIGLNSNGTHTLHNSNKLLSIPSKVIKFPLKRPRNKNINKQADDFVNKHVFLKFYTLKSIFKKIGLFDFVRKVYIKVSNHIN